MPAKTARSLKVLCPFCLDGESITIDLNDLGTVTCQACNEEFTAVKACEMLTAQAVRWAAVATWIDSAPVVK